MCVSSNVILLVDMVSHKIGADEQAQNNSESNGKKNARHKVNNSSNKKYRYLRKKKTPKVTYIMDHVIKTKWKRAGHLARLKENR